jgi:hypothetical protein
MSPFLHLRGCPPGCLLRAPGLPSMPKRVSKTCQRGAAPSSRHGHKRLNFSLTYLVACLIVLNYALGCIRALQMPTSPQNRSSHSPYKVLSNFRYKTYSGTTSSTTLLPSIPPTGSILIAAHPPRATSMILPSTQIWRHFSSSSAKSIRRPSIGS